LFFFFFQISNSTDLAWSASDLAQHKSKDAFAPLVKHLASRAAYIMKRCGEIARRMMDNRRRLEASSSVSTVENVDDATKYNKRKRVVLF
jgi:hypothetical protein